MRDGTDHRKENNERVRYLAFYALYDVGDQNVTLGMIDGAGGLFECRHDRAAGKEEGYEKQKKISPNNHKYA